MRTLSVFFAALMLLFCQAPRAEAQAEHPLTLVFSANSWGYLKPCPS